MECNKMFAMRNVKFTPSRRMLPVTSRTQRKNFVGPKQLFEEVRANRACQIVLLINSLMMAPWSRNMQELAP